MTPERRNPRRLFRKLALACLPLGLYVGSYAILSTGGGWVVTESGEIRMILAVPDVLVWQPRYGRCESFRNVSGDYGLRADGLGYFYSPLILFDQRYVHRTIRFIHLDGTSVQPLPAPPYEDYHPLRQNRFHKRFPYEQASDVQ